MSDELTTDEFAGLPILSNPLVPEGQIGIVQTGRSWGKTAYLCENAPEMVMRPVGELKGGTQYYEIVWPWIEREFGD